MRHLDSDVVGFVCLSPNLSQLSMYFLSFQAAFIAINCAWHAGHCAQFKRPEHFPLIGAYVGRLGRLFITYRGIGDFLRDLDH